MNSFQPQFKPPRMYISHFASKMSAQHLEQWITSSYFPADINAIKYTDAAARFGKGKGFSLSLVTGKTPGTTRIFLFVFGLTLPFTGIIIPIYYLERAIGIYNTPLAQAPITSLGILMSIWTWNQFLLALVLVENPTKRTTAGVPARPG